MFALVQLVQGELRSHLENILINSARLRLVHDMEDSYLIFLWRHCSQARAGRRRLRVRASDNNELMTMRRDTARPHALTRETLEIFRHGRGWKEAK